MFRIQRRLPCNCFQCIGCCRFTASAIRKRHNIPSGVNDVFFCLLRSYDPACKKIVLLSYRSLKRVKHTIRSPMNDLANSLLYLRLVFFPKLGHDIINGNLSCNLLFFRLSLRDKEAHLAVSVHFQHFIKMPVCFLLLRHRGSLGKQRIKPLLFGYLRTLSGTLIYSRLLPGRAATGKRFRKFVVRQLYRFTRCFYRLRFVRQRTLLPLNFFLSYGSLICVLCLFCLRSLPVCLLFYAFP